MEAKPTLRDLFEAALALPPSRRARLLDAQCTDPAVRAELERMLAADAAGDELLDTGDAALAAQAIGETEPPEPLPPGSCIGPFTLLDVLGEGGSSTVLRAFRDIDGVRQYVALKLLARGVYTAEARRRFHHERTALARLRHPGIARLIEGGVADNGLAYIALELIDGVPITSYVRKRGLSERQRLILFLQVCRAVESAHRALIVHRDLKPSNVLVTAEGEVKLLDFGIAKLLDDTEDATRTRHRALTPAYAAPEQFTPGAITTATDVYALGVLLREVLTGIHAVPDALRTARPRGAGGGNATSRGTSASRALRGDLASVVGKATAQEPERRYGSAGMLAEDIERYLDRLPVQAHPPTRWYRAGKFIVRHRDGVAVFAFLVLAILAALTIALRQAHVARVEAQLAQQQAVRANTVRDFLVSVFESASTALPRDQRPTPEDLVRHAADDLMAQNHLSPVMRVDLLLALAKVALSLGSYDRALALLDRADPVIAGLYGPSGKPWWEARVLRAEVLQYKARNGDVIDLLMPLRAKLFARRDPIGVAGLDALGDALLHSGRVDEGLSLLARARVIATRAGRPRLRLSASIEEAGALLDAEHFHDGMARADAALALWKSMGSRPNARVIELHEDMALGAEAGGDIARAEKNYREAIALGDRFFDRPNHDQAWDVGMYGSFLVAQGRLAEAEPYLVRGLELRRKVFGDDHPDTLYAIAGMGKLRYAQGRYKDAADWYTRGVDTCARTGLKELVCPRLLSLRSLAEGAAGQFAGAESDIRAALDMQAALGGKDNANYAYPLEKLAVLQLREHQYTAAIATTDRVLAIYRAVKGGMIQREFTIRLVRARALFALGRYAAALRELHRIQPGYAAKFPGGSLRFEINALEARSLAREHHRAEAAAAARKALAFKPPHAPDPRILAQLRQLAASG